MTWTPIVRKAFKLSELKPYIESLSFTNFKPSLIVWHNTALPTIQQWEKSAQQDKADGRIPGITRIRNLENYFKSMGWSSGPHWFVYGDVVWAFTPSNMKGTHSPSWNGISIGIEMIADFDKEDDETGTGLLIKKNTIALTAMLCEKLQLNPETAIKLHKEDKKTTHDCPGKNIAVDKEKMIDAVLEYMGHGGEHDDKPSSILNAIVFVNAGDTLNVREKSSASSKIVTKLAPNSKVKILNEAMNGNTKWVYIDTGLNKGWAAAQYIKEV